ncbi:MAG: hypothetical protein ACK41E_01370 [Deinococcales bacterium]
MKLESKLRETFDQTFMERLALVRVQVLDAKPPQIAQKSQIAKMFFLESQKSVLQNLAEITASWNSSEVNSSQIQKAMQTLQDMELLEARDHLGVLLELVKLPNA